MRLLKIEWLKLKKYRTFYILSGLFITIYTVLNIAVNRGAFTENPRKRWTEPELN